MNPEGSVLGWCVGEEWKRAAPGKTVSPFVSPPAFSFQFSADHPALLL